MPQVLRIIPERHTGKERRRISVFTVSSTKAPKEERLCMIEGHRSKGVTAELESASGQVPNCMI